MDRDQPSSNSLDSLVGYDLLQFPIREIPNYISRFAAIFEADPKRERLVKKLRKQKVVPTGKPLVFEHLLQLKLLDGVRSTILGIPREIIGLESYDFEFLAFLYVRTWDALPEFAHAEMRGRIHMGANEPQALVAIFFELVVAATYWKEGCTVEFSDILKSNVPFTNDFEISKPISENDDPRSLRYSVEVKTLDWTTSYPFNAKWMNEQLARLQKLLTSDASRWPTFHARVRFHSGGIHSHAELHDGMSNVLELISSGANSVVNSRFTVRLRSYFPAFEKSYVGSQKMLKEHGYITAIRTDAKKQQGLISLESESRHLHERIYEVLTDPKKKIDPKKPHVWWIAILGRHTLDDAHRRDVVKYFAKDTDGGKLLIKQNASGSSGSKGLLAIHIGGEPFAYKVGEDKCAVGFDHGIVGPIDAVDAVIEYRKHMLGMTDGSAPLCFGA